ncbi:hypothetical protein GWI33_019882 [Rhynchophorus ferrugineus]|uniref:Uncharacterized protein n=1 Tax=Rhynchophorus ferrugineus TaxID=354439 RepID=A0A834HRW8_RHYFE|nr:hypothetical protein GWI33_019882 [Rhynchophorus ferrugineus]
MSNIWNHRGSTPTDDGRRGRNKGAVARRLSHPYKLWKCPRSVFNSYVIEFRTAAYFKAGKRSRFLLCLLFNANPTDDCNGD